MEQKRWVFKKEGNPEEVAHIAQELNISAPLANLLVQRGVKTFEDAKKFFRPSLNNLFDPFLMRDMEIAVERLEIAIHNKEKILIYGDYDVDGTTAVAMMYSFLRKRHSNLGYYIPDRFDEGYGISFKGVDHAAQHGYTLVIALDCGIKESERVDYATSKGIDFIICDHHQAGETIPSAVAVLDPKRPDCPYPFKELSGCGVGFKLLQAFAMRNDIPFELLVPFLDLVAVSIASDIVPITGENRILAHFGLKRLNSDPRQGLKSIIDISGIKGKEIFISDIVFRLGPRINAAGRIEKGKTAVDLLVAENLADAETISRQINEDNNTRKDIDRAITQEAMALIAGSDDMSKRKTTVLYNPNWAKGVVGIVASRLIEVYYRPTIVLTESNGLVTGSARSVEGFDLYKAIESCSHLLESFGGHIYAAGLSLKKENLTAFIEEFEKNVAATITPIQQIPQIAVDLKLNLDDINPKFYRILKQFEPFGPENMTPVFVSENVCEKNTGKLVGKECEHLKFDLSKENEIGKPFPAIGFKMAHFFNLINDNKPFDICYSVEEDEFNGSKKLQIKIRDIKAGHFDKK